MKWIDWSKDGNKFGLNHMMFTNIFVIVNNTTKTKSCNVKSKPLFLQSKTAQLVREQNVAMSEQQAAYLAGLYAREMEVHAQAQAAELDKREVRLQEEWQLMQQECVKLTKDKEVLMMDLVACQDTIREESQACQQYRRQLLGPVQLPQLIDGPRAHRVPSELWGAGTGDAVDSRDDGRSLRQTTNTGNARDGGRPTRDGDGGFGHPVGFAVGATAHENSYH